ncbi:MAG: hypothetical protein QG620_519 [Patescibacteria group bacterium]|nr:hypothetical protein [Patescibacteria group bacterium]
MPPILVSPEVVFYQTQSQASGERFSQMSAVDLGRENGNVVGARFQIFGVDIESVKHRRGGKQRKQGEDNDGSPIFFQEVFAGNNEREKQDEKNGGSDAPGDVGVDADAENEAADGKIIPFFRPQAFPQEIKRKSQNGRQHIGAERNAGKVDGPKRHGREPSAYEPGAAAEKFLGQKVRSKYGERAENYGREF